jgi:4-aminobutyrate aminotransferase-like enzyme
MWDEALGSNVLDADGNRFVDLTSGFGAAAIGHRNRAVVEAVRSQTGKLLHGLGDVHSHEKRSELARRLVGHVPIENAQVFFGVSGSDAVEIAVKTALMVTSRKGVLAFRPAYHGLSMGALHLTSRPAFRQPFAAHLHCHAQHLPYGCSTGEIEAWFRRHADTACVVVEPIVGREGVLLPPTGWLGELHRLCQKHGSLLVVDEIFTGFGRTGRWFAIQHEQVEPDLLCCGKALGGGLPIAATIGRRDLFEVWAGHEEALHTGTFVAHPLACAAALATLEVLESERLAQRAARFGKRTQRRIDPWSERFSGVCAVRGRGMMWGVELADSTRAHRLTRSLLAMGILALAGGPEGRVLQLLPPLVIDESQWLGALDIIESQLNET